MIDNKNNIKLSCLVGTVYTLFLSLLIIDEKDYYKTYFFIDGAGISEKIASKLPNGIYINVKKELKESFILRFIKRIKRFHFRKVIWPFLKYTPIIGQDHLYISPGIIGRGKIEVIEDGIGNYIEVGNLDKFVNLKVKNRYLNNFLFGPISSHLKYGHSLFASKVFLTGIAQIPDRIKEKTTIIDPYELWSNKSAEYKGEILRLFDCDIADIEMLSGYDVLILTQPLAPKFMPEPDLLDIYKKIIELNPNKKILIKTHPRDTINYKLHFKVDVFEKPIPIELLGLLKIRISKAYTIISTSILSLPKETKKIILGAQCHPELESKLKDIDNYEELITKSKVSNCVYGKLI